MANLQAPVLIVFDQVMIRIARKSQGVQPKRIYRRCAHVRQPRPICYQMRQIVAQDVVANQMCRSIAKRLQSVQRRLQSGPFVNNSPLTPHRRKGKQIGRFWINLKINRNATRQK